MSLNTEELARVVEPSVRLQRLDRPDQPDQFVPDQSARYAHAPSLFSDPTAGERRFDLFSQRLSEICYMETVTAEDIQAGKVTRDRFEVFIMPGGYVSVTHAALGPQGEKALSEFVHAGGGWLGSCLGGFIPSLPYAAVLGVQQLDEEHWERGIGTVRVAVTDEGRNILGTQYGTVDMYFRGGPLLKAAEGWNEHVRATVPQATILGTYLNEIGEPKYYHIDAASPDLPRYGFMVGSGAIACGIFGSGRVLVFGPHPECSSYSLIEMIANGLFWVAKKERQRIAPPAALQYTTEKKESECP